MPVQVMITSAEAEAAATAGVGFVQGRIFIYDPSQTMEICEKLSVLAAEGSKRLITRLADVYGKNFVFNPEAPSPPPATVAIASKKLRGRRASQIIIDDPLRPPGN